jgi:HEPN domain-containing protein
LPRKTDSNNPADWIWIAENDFAAIRLAAEREISFNFCRSRIAEVLEKVLKAELIRHGWHLERTHDLQRLRDALVAHDPVLATEVKSLCDGLAEFYFIDRYPGFDLDDPSWPLLRNQIDEVGNLLRAVKQRLGGTAV